MLSPASLRLFDTLLKGVQLNAAADDFEEVALQVIQARKEVAEAIGRLTKPEHNGRVTRSPNRTAPAT